MFMKKGISLVLIALLLLTACNQKKEEVTRDSTFKEVTKIDASKDYVYFETLRQITDEYSLQYAIINLNSDSVSNINLELKSFVNKSCRNMIFSNDVFEQGNIISYEYFVSEHYITLIQNYTYFVHNKEREPNSFTYVVDKSTGKLLTNQEILDSISMKEDDLFSFILDYDGLEDNLYVVSVLKNNGYQLYFDDIEHLVLRYYDVHNEGVEKRELLFKMNPLSRTK